MPNSPQAPRPHRWSQPQRGSQEASTRVPCHNQTRRNFGNSGEPSVKTTRGCRDSSASEEENRNVTKWSPSATGRLREGCHLMSMQASQHQGSHELSQSDTLGEDLRPHMRSKGQHIPQDQGPRPQILCKGKSTLACISFPRAKRTTTLSLAWVSMGWSFLLW